MVCLHLCPRAPPVLGRYGVVTRVYLGGLRNRWTISPCRNEHGARGRLAPMTQFLQEADEGCLLLADITGYTSYLQGSELEHAQDVLTDLLETIINGIEPPFELSKLEGDAAFAYLTTERIDTPMLMDTIESTYFNFRRRLRDVVHATTCDCNACVLIPSLDLKFVVHQGRYVVRRIGRSEELTGSDVVLVHRLLKNSVRDIVGNDAYVAITASAIAAMDADPTVLGLQEHTESLDTGDVDVWIENLEDRWRSEQDRHRQQVSDAEATATFSFDMPISPQELWPWLTDPSLRIRWEGGLTSITEDVDSRRGVGTVNHCAHGDNVVLQTIVDWQPFSSFTTTDRAGIGDVTLTVTTTLTAADTGTEVKVSAICEPPEAWAIVGPLIEGQAPVDRARLIAILTENGSPDE
jgi:hypothetical protein